MFFKRAVLKKFVIFTGKHLSWSLFFKKLQALMLATLLKRDCNTDVFIEHIWWQLLLSLKFM